MTKKYLFHRILIGTDVGLILMYNLAKDYREYSVYEGHQVKQKFFKLDKLEQL